MKVTETLDRECCQSKDLRPVEGTPKRELRIPEVMFCIHCGHRHIYERYMDGAGSMDWRYAKQKETYGS